MRSNNLIILNVIIIQLTTAIFLLLSPTEIRVATLGVFYNIFTIPSIGAALMIMVAIVALVGFSISTKNRLRFLFFLPQFIFLLLTSGSSLSYVLSGQYADGIIRPWYFILIDQLYPLVLVVLYTLSIFDFRKDTNGHPTN